MSNEPRSFQRLDFSSLLPGGLLQNIVVDAVFPYMLYQFIAPRTTYIVGLLIMALFPLVGFIVRWYQKCGPDVLAIGVLIAIGFAIATTWLTGDARILLLHFALPLGLTGIVLLLSHFFSRPLWFYVDRYVNSPMATRPYDQLWLTSRAYRATMVRINVVWGVALLLAALSLLGLFFALAAASFVSIEWYVQYGVPGLVLLLGGWTLYYRGKQAQRWLPAPEKDLQPLV